MHYDILEMLFISDINIILLHREDSTFDEILTDLRIEKKIFHTGTTKKVNTAP